MNYYLRLPQLQERNVLLSQITHNQWLQTRLETKRMFLFKPRGTKETVICYQDLHQAQDPPEHSLVAADLLSGHLLAQRQCSVWFKC